MSDASDLHRMVDDAVSDDTLLGFNVYAVNPLTGAHTFLRFIDRDDVEGGEAREPQPHSG